MTLFRWLRSALAPRSAPRTRPATRRLAVELLEDRLTPSTGGLLDPTFGSGGQVMTSFSNNYDAAYATIAQPDGKVLVAGSTTASGSKTGSDFLVARYNINGTLDSTFGSSGYTTTDFGSNETADAIALQRQADGSNKILVAGLTTTTKKGSTYDLFAVARYNANGTLDTTFGTRGKVTIDLGNSSSPSAMAVDGSGRIVVVGISGGDAALVRYTANGTLDTTFGSGGKLITNIRVFVYASHSVGIALQPDGRIVLGSTTLDPATSTGEFLTARFNANGSADSTFGSGGVVTTHLGSWDEFGGVTMQGDGKIVVGGSESQGTSPFALYLLRYNGDGSLDANFGMGGTVAAQAPDGHFIDVRGSGVTVQADGKIVAGGEFGDATGQFINLAALRVNPDGSVETGYGNGGWATAPFAAADMQAIALEPDGRLLLAGYARPTSNNRPTDVALIRFLGSAPQIGSFTASYDSVADSLALTASGIIDGNPNSTVTQVAFYADSNSDGVLDPGDTLLGYGTQTNPGVWTYTFTVNLTPGTYMLFVEAQDSYGALGDPLACTLQV